MLIYCCVMECREPSLTFVVDVLLISHFLQDKFDCVVAAKLRCDHQRSHFFLIELGKLLRVMTMKDLQCFRRLKGSSVMNWFPTNTVPHIKFGDVLQNISKELSIGINNSTMDRTTKVSCAALFKHSALFKHKL